MTTSLDTARDDNKLKIGVGLFDLSEHYYKRRSNCIKEGKMNLHDEIARVARELYEKSGEMAGTSNLKVETSREIESHRKCPFYLSNVMNGIKI